MGGHVTRASDEYLLGWTSLEGLIVAGRLNEALVAVENLQCRFPQRSAAMTHARACLLALMRRPDDALEIMCETVDAGSWWSRHHVADPDLAPLVDRPAFAEYSAVMHQRAATAVEDARKAKVGVLHYSPTGPTRAVIVALHMSGVTAAETAAIWEPTVAGGLAVCVPESTLRNGDGLPCWDDEELAERDVQAAVCEAQVAAGNVPLLLAGGSQGAGVAARLALDGQIEGCRGFIGVVGAPVLASVEHALSAAARRGLHGFLVAGELDPLPRQRQQNLNDRLVAAGVDCRLIVIPGLRHVYPADWVNTAREAVDYCLGITDRTTPDPVGA